MIVQLARLWLVALVFAFATPARAEAPWAAADALRRVAAGVERGLYRPEDAALRRELAQELAGARAGWAVALAPAYAAAGGEAGARVAGALGDLEAALAVWDGRAAARARGALWAGLLDGAFRLTLAALADGDGDAARGWLGIREYARASGDTAADLAMAELLAGRIAPAAARRVIEAELLRIYAGELRRALQAAAEDAQAGRAIQLAGDLGRARGLYHLLAGNIAARLDASATAAVAQGFAALQAADRAGADPAPALAELSLALAGYSPAALSADERERRVRLLSRFLGLVHIEYKDGVRDGQVTVAMEYHEARLFRDRARMILADLQAELAAADPAAADRLLALLDELRRRIEAKADPAAVKALTDEAQQIVQAGFGIDTTAGGHRVALQVLPDLLDELALVVQSGDYAEAELKRLEAYALFDPDIEQRLVPRAPALALTLEARFWQG
ncbi:MAG TPA: hypothetical protein VGA75_12955, partial [Paracoccaceae bacterium]